jgi:hypothetical protein
MAIATYSRWYWFKWRLAGLVHPESVVAAWYAQDCPPSDRFDASSLSRRERVGWAISKWLRECKKRAVRS